MYCLICFMLEITLDVLQLKILQTLMCIDLMMNCIVGLKIYHKYYHWNNQLNRYFNFDHIWHLPPTICSFCMELKLLFFFMLIVQLVQCDFSPNWWRTLIFANTMSIVPFAWNLIYCIIFDVRYSLNTNLDVI